MFLIYSILAALILICFKNIKAKNGNGFVVTVWVKVTIFRQRKHENLFTQQKARKLLKINIKNRGEQKFHVRPLTKGALALALTIVNSLVLDKDWFPCDCYDRSRKS